MPVLDTCGDVPFCQDTRQLLPRRIASAGGRFEVRWEISVESKKRKETLKKAHGFVKVQRSVYKNKVKGKKDTNW